MHYFVNNNVNFIFFAGLGSQAVGDIVAKMSEDIGDRAESSASLPLVKTEAGSPGPAPPLLPLAARDAAEKQQVKSS